MNRHKVFWALWVGAFLAYELPAVFNAAQEDTFSEFFWGLFHINDSLPLWQSIPIHGAIVAFGVWLIGHLAFGLWGGPKGRILDGEPAELRDLPKQVVNLVHKVDALADGWAEGDDTRKAELWNALHNANAAVWNRFDGRKPVEPPEFPDHITRIIGESQGIVFMGPDPDGPLPGQGAECPGCKKAMAFNGQEWRHVSDNSPMCPRDRNGYMTGMKGHRWKDTRGPLSMCDGCHLYYSQWGGGPCIKALPGTDYRI